MSLSLLAQADLGRDFATIRNGPRPIDLDIIFYEDENVNAERLIIPHPRWQERSFVTAPLADLAACLPQRQEPASDGIESLLTQAASIWSQGGGERQVGGEAGGLAAWLPLGRTDPKQRGLAWGGAIRPHVMGILNLTPDSFSDGGVHLDNARGSGHLLALNAARQMVAAGASIIDVGGQSTRPGAELVSAENEAQRVVPFIQYVIGILSGVDSYGTSCCCLHV